MRRSLFLTILSNLAMETFESYSRELERLATSSPDLRGLALTERMVDDILDGQPSRTLRELVPLMERRQAGAFFTGRQLARRLIEPLIPDIRAGSGVADLACGAGDLLLESAAHLPLREDLEGTLEEWGARLSGLDIYPQFVRTTKARLVLLALQLGAKPHSPIPAFQDLLPRIRVGDGLGALDGLLTANCIALNPPFNQVLVPEKCGWATGSICQAALFLEKCVTDASPGTRIGAILPDVLRTGSRYLRWREHIESKARVEAIETVGRFDPLTDVDVFIGRFTVGRSESTEERDWWASRHYVPSPGGAVGDAFEVRVGPVVPHRDPLEGPLLPYIHAQRLATWKSVDVSDLPLRQFAGTTFMPPFVVVRRTSRPEDHHRAVGTVIIGNRPTAVENHLMVLRPTAGSLEDCLRLLDNLRSPETDTWLNERIRCRHLTVSALRALPWWQES